MYTIHILLIFICTLTMSSGRTLPVWDSDLVRVYSCNSLKELKPSRIIRNASLVRAELTRSSKGWVQFLSPMDPYVQMYGVKSNGEWYFMEMIGGRIRLIKNNLPSGFIPLSDGRYFSYQREAQSSKHVLKHIVSQTVVKLYQSLVVGEIVPELAGNFCQHILETNYNPLV